MENVTIDLVTHATGGKYFGRKELLNTNVTSVEIDSRKIKPGGIFVPIVGDNVDGHYFIPDVMKEGAVCTFSERKLPESYGPYILVESSKQALIDLAKYYRAMLDIKVVGITGSVGKTSTKEMIASVLGQEYNIFKTIGNKNNDIGISLMISQINSTHEIAILEMGISEFREMHRLSEIVRPDVCVINNIENCHLEGLVDRDGVLKAKSEIFDFMNPEGYIILNNDDDKLRTIKKVNEIEPIRFGIETSSDIMAFNIVNKGLEGSKTTLKFYGKTIDVNIPAPGKHVILNALAAVSVGTVFNLKEDSIKTGIEINHSVDGRMKIIKNNYTIIDGHYNASEASMKAGLNVLSYANQRKVAILGDMLELGDYSEQLHKEVGKYAVLNRVDLLICIGEKGEYIFKGANEANTYNETKTYYFNNNKAFLKDIFKILKDEDAIFIKASNGMNFKEIFDVISKEK